MIDAASMSDAEFRTFVVERLTALSGVQPTDETFTRDEAARYVKRPHPKAFDRFKARTGLKPYARNRYTRRACDVALAREQRGYRKESAA